MRCAIFNQYFETLGGGERYAASVASILSKKGWEVYLEWKDSSIIKSLENRFNLDLANIRTKENLNRGDGFDLTFWISDGSIPALKGRLNILHFQMPFIKVNGKSLMNKMKFFRIKKTVCNSFFTKKFIDKEYGIESFVIYPPVPVEFLKPLKKENMILSVGRFSQLAQMKRQDILVGVFKKLYDLGYNNWRLVLAGGSEVGSKENVNKIKKISQGYPIEIIENPDFKGLKTLYGQAKIFWSASGYGVDETKEPMKVEHFGITVVEAMAAGVVPLVFLGGGHKEIIDDALNGFLWKSTSSLLSNTTELIKDQKYLKKVSLEAIKKAQNYSYESFEKKFSEII